MSKHKIEFSKYALSYSKHNSIQNEIAKELIDNIGFEPKNIVDLGAGSGQIYNHITWSLNSFIAIDFSQAMCNLHKKADLVEVICEDFDNQNLYSLLENRNYDIILSSSALQWSKDLDKIVNFLKNKKFYISIFTSNTFKTIQDITKLKSPILSKDKILSSFSKVDNVKINEVKYSLKFENNRDIFRYIKESGVSGGISKLGYIETKKLIQNYPNKYLEFEVLFIKNY